MTALREPANLTLVNVDAIQPKGVNPLTQEPNPRAIVRSIAQEGTAETLTEAAFSQLSGNLGGYPFVKLVIDKPKNTIHFINHAYYDFHADYIAENILGVPKGQVEKDIDAFNRSVYFDLERRFYLAILAKHKAENRKFYTLETVEVDTMNAEMLRFLYDTVRSNLEKTLPVFLKPANHYQESIISGMDPNELPRIFSHELFNSSRYIALNPGTVKGRLRAFETEQNYRENRHTIEWYDILVMNRVPDDIPRVSGIINAQHTTPLSHTNVLATGWQIPNAIELGIFDRLSHEGMGGQWVEYSAQANATQIQLRRIDRPAEADKPPVWRLHKIKIEQPETVNIAIRPLDQLRMGDRYKYGTKAANLGELRHVLENGSPRLTGFYSIPRPPRRNLLPHLARFLGTGETSDLAKSSWAFLKDFIRIPRGIAVPFSVQQDFLQSSPQIQQAIGKLKMALELNAKQVDAQCLSLQQMIRAARLPERIRSYIDAEITRNLAGVSTFVVRSSSNAEDLERFSAAGIYESINHVTTADNIFESIKQVWASLISPRSVRLRQEVGISLDDSYMGVIIQEELKQDELKGDIGGVLVTTNPLNKQDFRNVYFNISPSSVETVVQGNELPYQYLYNTVEGGGRTLAISAGSSDLTELQKATLQKLAYAGRLLQSHFSPDYTFSAPVDIEWLVNEQGVFILQLRPYSK